MKLAIYSKGIRKIPNLSAFLPEYDEVVFREPAEHIAAWGRKKNTKKPREVAEKAGAKFISLEDGFIRSYGLGVDGAAPLSMVVDDLGVYYEAAQPSRLEELVKHSLSDEETARAREIIQTIKANKVSKYNCSVDEWKKPTDKPAVLVVDQSAGDASVEYGLADKKAFARMLTAAREENPGYQVIIKTHPDVLAGKRRGCIDLSKAGDAIIISENINPYTIFEQVEKVYVATSLMGMEALIAGKEVRCFGMPFYAGWGLTDDEQSCDRRDKRSLEELVFGAYVRYARYINPFNAKPTEIEEVLNIISDAKEYYSGLASHYHCFGFSLWKRSFLKSYLKSPFNKVSFYWSEEKALRAAKQRGGKVVVWAASEPEGFAGRAKDFDVVRVEDGFIRSKGLGSNLVPPYSLIFDKLGIYFDCSKPSALENIYNSKSLSDSDLGRAKALREDVINQSITKYNTEERLLSEKLPADKVKILVVGQVEGDASIRLGSPNIKTNSELLQLVRQKNQDAYIIYKPHPDVISKNRDGQLKATEADLIAEGYSLHPLLKEVDEVHTITSLVGFEALMHEKKVVTYGAPFYSGWGLTGDLVKIERRKGKLSIDELVAGALIKYPAYFDCQAKLPTNPEQIIEKLASSEPYVVKSKLLLKLKNLWGTVLDNE